MRRRQEDGAVAVVVAAMMTVLVLIAAFAVDLGMQRVVRRDLQALADVVAVDLARELDGSSQADLAAEVNPASPTSALSRSLARNAVNVLGDAPEIAADWGSWDGATWNTTAEPPTAVRVVAAGAVGFAFRPGAGAASRTAYAVASSGACYQVGSYGAQVNLGRAALFNTYFKRLASTIGRFDNSDAVRLIDYRGLAGATVSLDNVAARLGLGSVEQLASSTVSLKNFYEAIHLELMDSAGETAVVNALQTLHAQAHSNVNIALDRILGITSGSGVGLGLRGNVLDLVGGSLVLLNGTNLLDLDLGAEVPGLVNANGKLRLVQGPRQYCGRPGDAFSNATAGATEQLRFQATATLNPVTYPITIKAGGILGTSVSLSVTGPNTLPVTVSLAPTVTRLTGLDCGPPSSTAQGITLDVGNSLAKVTVGPWYVSNLEFQANVLGIGLVRVRFNANVKATVDVSSGEVTGYSIDVPPQSFDTFYPTTSSGLALDVDLSESQPGYIGITLASLIPVVLPGDLLSGLVDSVLEAVVEPLFDTSVANSLVNALINPVLSLAGADLGGSDISLNSTPPPSCARPRLAG